jgi:hypothetical protein
MAIRVGISARRAAIYILLVHLGCLVVYHINSVTHKAKELVADMINSDLAKFQQSIDRARVLYFEEPLELSCIGQLCSQEF